MAFQSSKYLTQAYVEIKLNESFKAELEQFTEELVFKELRLDGVKFNWTPCFG